MSLSFTGVASYIRGKEGLSGMDKLPINNLYPFQSSTPGRAPEDGISRKDFADPQNEKPLTASFPSGRPVFGGDKTQIKGPSDAEIGMSINDQLEGTTTFSFGANQAKIETVTAKAMRPALRPGIIATTLASMEAEQQKRAIPLNDPSPAQFSAAVAANKVETNITGYTANQSGSEDKPPSGEGFAPGEGKKPGEEPEDVIGEVRRLSPARENKPYISLVREARKSVGMLTRPYTFRQFKTLARKLYPIDSLMPRDENRLSFKVAIMARNMRVLYAQDGRQRVLVTYDLLRIMNDDLSEENVDVFHRHVVPRFAQLDHHPTLELREVSIDRLYLQDGRNTDRHITMDMSFLETLESGKRVTHYGQLQYTHRWLQEQFTRAVRRLIGEDATTAIVKMHRFPEECLRWREDVDPSVFVTEIIWKIDHTIINVYPPEWRPTLTFEEAEDERERAARAALAAEVQGTQYRATENPATRVPVADPQTTRDPVTQPQRAAGDPSGSAEHGIPQILTRLDNIEQVLQQAIADGKTARKSGRAAQAQTKATIAQIERLVDNATVMPTFRCPYPSDTCGVGIPAEPRDTFEMRVNRHLHTHLNGGGRPCPMDINCHARLDLMNAGQVATHAIMHSNHRQQQQPLGPAPIVAPLLPPAEILPEEPPRGPRSPSVPGSEESDVAGAPRPGAHYCGKCHKFINNLRPGKKRAHLDECMSKKRNMKTKMEIATEKLGDLTKAASKRENKRRKADDDYDHEHGGNQNDEEISAGDEDDAGEVVATYTAQNSRVSRPPAKKARGNGAAKTATKKRKDGEEKRKDDKKEQEEHEDDDADDNTLAG